MNPLNMSRRAYALQARRHNVKRIITDNPHEKITITGEDERVSLIHRVKDDQVKVIILNKREALSVYEFIGQWAKEGK